MKYDVIVDCYTDEPSGLGVPPFLSVHSRYIAGALEEQKRKYYYLTIDDLRYSNGENTIMIHIIKESLIQPKIKIMFLTF